MRIGGQPSALPLANPLGQGLPAPGHPPSNATGAEPSTTTSTPAATVTTTATTDTLSSTQTSVSTTPAAMACAI